MKFLILIATLGLVAASAPLPYGAARAAESAWWKFVKSNGLELPSHPRVQEFPQPSPVRLMLSPIKGVDATRQTATASFTLTAVPSKKLARDASSVSCETVEVPAGFQVNIEEPPRQLSEGEAALQKTAPQVFHVDVNVPVGTAAGVHKITFEVAGVQINAFVPVGRASVAERRYIYATNDFHGRLPGSAAGDAFTGAVALAEFLGGQPYPDDGIFVSAGDNIGASLYESASAQDLPTMEALKAMNLVVTAVGNHEFDGGYDRLNSTVRQALDCPLLGANVFTTSQKPALDAWAVVDINGVKIGFVGVVTSSVPSLVAAAGIDGLVFNDAIASANAALESAKGQADVWILLAHQGAEDGTSDLDTELGKGGEFAEIVEKASSDFHAIMTGHTHQSYFWETKSGIPVIQTGCYAQGMAVFDLAVEMDGNTVKLLDFTTSLEDASLEKWWVDEQQHKIDKSVVKSTLGKEVFDIVSRAIEEAEEKGKTVLGRITASIERAKTPQGVENRGAEGQLVQAAADAMLEFIADYTTDAHKDTVISIVNPGGVRDDLIYDNVTKGNVTERMAVNVLPFANTLTTSKLTGEQIRTILNQQWQPEGSERPFLHLGVAGLSFSYDWDAKKVELSDILGPDGKALEAKKVYKVGTNNFLQDGGDQFFEFKNGQDISDTGAIDSDSLRNYFTVRKEVSPPWIERAVNKSLDTRSQADFWIDSQSGTLSPGSNVSYQVRLSSKVDLPGPFFVLGIYDIRNDANDQFFDAQILATASGDLPTGSELQMQADVSLGKDVESAELRIFAALDVYDGNPLPGGLGLTIYPSSSGALPVIPLAAGLMGLLGIVLSL